MFIFGSWFSDVFGSNSADERLLPETCPAYIFFPQHPQKNTKNKYPMNCNKTTVVFKYYTCITLCLVM